MAHYLIILVSLLSYSMVGSQSLQKPKVLIITTGGTIASQTKSPMIEGPALVQAVPQIAEFAEIEVEEFVRIGSSKMTPGIWLDLVKRIKIILEEKPEFKCIIITHGTDSMEETAFFLNLTHQSKIPIVLVGSMRSADRTSADGPINLLNAIRVGLSEDAKGKGVMVVMNDNIHAARDLLKMNNTRVDAFPSTERGFLGGIDQESINFFRTPTKPHTSESEFNVYKMTELAQVDIVSDFAGFDAAILSYYLNRPSQGLVISSFAGGRMSNGFNGLRDLDEKHKPIVIASSIKAGRIPGSHTKGSPIIIANDLPPNKARVLLMLALTVTSDPVQIQEIFNKY